MNRRFITAAIAALIVLPSSVEARQGASFDAAWRFSRGEFYGAEEPGFNDSSWQVVDTPHDWSIEGPFAKYAPATGRGAFLPTGVGWYRKSFTAPGAGERVVIEFDGVMANSDVWINGVHLGHRPNGYVSFRYELTDHLLGQGQQNVVAVRVDTSQQPASRWYAGSGIYRHVRLVTGGAPGVTPSVFVTTPTADADNAKVDVSVELEGPAEVIADAVVEATLIDPQGETMATASAPVGTNGPTRLSFDVAGPQLWGLDSSAMYSVAVTVRREDEVDGEIVSATLAEDRERFGVRTAEFRADSGFWLNGENLKLKGVCLHHDGGAFGAAVPLDVWRHRFARLKELGVNAIRTAHNPPAPELLDLCDEMGLLVMEEFFDCWTRGKTAHDYHKDFTEWWRDDLADTVRRDRNHPSVILWSVGNEIRDTHDAARAKRLLSQLVEACHAADPSRPVTQALFRPNVTHDYDNGLADLLDVVGTNYRDRELLKAWRDNPARKIIGTEQSHDRSTWLNCRDYPQHAGQFLWVGVDYLGESRRWPVTTFDSGLIDRSGALYPRGAERQSWWSDTPMVRAYRRTAPTEATPEDPGYEEEEWVRSRVLFDDWSPLNRMRHNEQVEVYSNCEEVELVLNGKSLGAKPLSEDLAPRVWTVRYEPGELVAIGRNGGEVVDEHRLRSCGAPTAIRLSIDRVRLDAGWDDVAHVVAMVIDAEGVPVPTASHPITFSVTGPARVVATDNGSTTSHKPFQSPERRALGGRCVAYLKATGQPGDLTVTASAVGLEPGQAAATLTGQR